jgi:DNA primase small subunit
MDILHKPETWNKVLEIIPDATIREKLSNSWSENEYKSSKEKWDMLVTAAEKQTDKQKSYNKDMFARDIMFQYCYPRLDIKVTTGINHLLKSPFCVHPKTCKYNIQIAGFCIIITFSFLYYSKSVRSYQNRGL